MIQLDVTSDAETPFIELRTTLEGQDYDFAFRWNDRRGLWCVDVATQAGEMLVASRVLRHQTNILSRCRSPNKPPGMLFCWVNTPGDLRPPGLEDLGSRAGIYYWTAAELAQ